MEYGNVSVAELTRSAYYMFFLEGGVRFLRRWRYRERSPCLLATPIVYITRAYPSSIL